MFRPPYLANLLLGAIATVAALGACAPESGQNDDGYATETEACKECQGILVECTSTSRDETQFVACRDQWQSCQDSKGLDIGTCSNPGDTDACDLCRTRMTACKGKAGSDAATCEEEFGICKAYLITRGDIQQQCTSSNTVDPTVACSVCQKDMAVCLSDVSMTNAMAVCTSKFEQCNGANGLSQGQCTAPSGAKACTLCTGQHDACSASAGPSCEAGFEQCAKSIATGVTCELAGEGGGGSGGGGTGGSGGGTSDCAHDACVTGVALTAGCDGSSCVNDVCAQDDWCCTNEWDEFCVQKAEAIVACGCGA